MSTTIPRPHTTPRVWVGCPYCYGCGDLVGRWVNGTEADTITVEQVHRRPMTAAEVEQHAELWCMDREGYPSHLGEMSNSEAQQWAEVITSVEDHLQPALTAWVESGSYVAQVDTDLPCVEDFTERYCGQWDDFSDHAHNLAEDIGLLDGVPESVATYFDLDSFSRDLAYDYTVLDSSHGTVWVYQNV